MLRVIIMVTLVVPAFWLIVSPLWLPFTPVWFDAASLVVGGLATLALLALGSQDHFDYKKTDR